MATNSIKMIDISENETANWLRLDSIEQIVSLGAVWQIYLTSGRCLIVRKHIAHNILDQFNLETL